jgi:hypothetical protein
MKWFVVATALFLVPVLAGAGVGPADCDMKLLGKAETRSGSEMPSVAARDKVFACAGIECHLPAEFDQLDKDLLFMAPTYLDFESYLARYTRIPPEVLKRLWDLVQDFQAAKGAPRQAK